MPEVHWTPTDCAITGPHPFVPEPDPNRFWHLSIGPQPIVPELDPNCLCHHDWTPTVCATSTSDPIHFCHLTGPHLFLPPLHRTPTVSATPTRDPNRLCHYDIGPQPFVPLRPDPTHSCHGARRHDRTPTVSATRHFLFLLCLVSTLPTIVFYSGGTYTFAPATHSHYIPCSHH